MELVPYLSWRTRKQGLRSAFPGTSRTQRHHATPLRDRRPSLQLDRWNRRRINLRSRHPKRCTSRALRRRDGACVRQLFLHACKSMVLCHAPDTGGRSSASRDKPPLFWPGVRCSFGQSRAASAESTRPATFHSSSWPRRKPD